MKKLLSLLFAVLLVVGAVPSAFAVDEVAPAAAAEEFDYSYGTVVSASATEITLTEYDPEADKDVEMKYAVDPKVELENIASLAEIKAGDDIEIEFVDRSGVKTITYVARDEYEEDLALDASDMTGDVAPDQPEAAPAAASATPQAQ